MMWSTTGMLGFLFVLPLCHLSAGEWGQWSAMSSCTQTCGMGTHFRTRVCAEGEGQCEGDDTDVQACAYNSCPRDGTWAPWGVWSACSQSCEGGRQERTRVCDGPYDGGAPCVGDDDTQEQDCNVFGCPVDGAWSVWGEFSQCTATCGGGTKIAYRECNNPAPANNGRNCIGSEQLLEACGSEACPDSGAVNGQWSPWSLIGECSVTCGMGVRTRTRTCTNPAPTNGGEDCVGDDEMEYDCETPPCPVDGGWGWWTEWGQCSASCLGGYQSRSRLCNRPTPAHGGRDCPDHDYMEPGVQTDVVECNTGTCSAVDGSWGEWSNVGLCSKTCGGGAQQRKRSCNSPPPMNGGRPCPGGDVGNANQHTEYVGCKFNPCPQHGNWGAWSNYTDCSTTCGHGVRTRVRLCDNPAPQHGGVNCLGNNTDTENCDQDECDVDGGWSSWSPYSPCSHSCGGGTQHRVRECNSPPASGTGAECQGAVNQTQTCNPQQCPPVNGGWSAWGEWDRCSVTCEDGIRTRIRSCDNPPPSNGGNDCVGKSTVSQLCHEGECPLDSSLLYGVCDSWSYWSDCSVTCAGGQRRRMRTCTDRPPDDSPIRCDVVATNEIEILHCNTDPCPVDGGWSSWSFWTPCTESCGYGKTSRKRRCDNPAPSGGGATCDGASEYNDLETQLVPCHLRACSNQKTTTQQPQPGDAGSQTTEAPLCLAETTHGTLIWPQTIIGETVSLFCPAPSTGNATRTCEGRKQWADVDTSQCKSPEFDELENTLSNSDIWFNTSALVDAVDEFEHICSAENIVVSENLKKCHDISVTLLHKNLPGDPTIHRGIKEPMLKSLLNGVGGMLDISNKDQWKGVTKQEETEHVSMLADIVYNVETLGHQIAAYLQEDKRSAFCPSSLKNIDFCVERLTCDGTSYRFPYDPPDPTPPPKHIRGGWVAPEKPKLTFMKMSATLIDSVACKGIIVGGTTDTFAITAVHENVHKFLPDINKQYIDADEESEPGVRYSRRPNSPIITASLMTKVNTSHLADPLLIKLYHNKTAEDVQCAFIPRPIDASIYDTRGCREESSGENFTVCECDHMTAFLLVMQPVYIPPEEEIVSKADSYIKAGCIIAMVVMIAMCLTYLLSKLWKQDKYFILINICTAIFLAEFFIINGGQIENIHACRFLSFMSHWFVITAQLWVIGLTTHAYKHLESPEPFTRHERIVYCLVGWGMPLFAPAVSIGLDFDHYVMEDFCWMTWNHRVSVGFYLPHVLLCASGCVILLLAYRILDSKTRSIADEEEEIEAEKQKVYILKALGLVIFSCLNWLSFSVLITPMFMSTNLVFVIYILLVFCVLDRDVQVALGNVRTDIREARRRKAHEVKVNEEVPDWVRDTNTTHNKTTYMPTTYMKPTQKENWEMRPREKLTPSPPGHAYMPKSRRSATPHF